MTLSALRVILFLSTLKLSIPQFGIQLMVRKLYVQFIFSNFRFILFFHPLFDFLSCQILPEETPTQAQELGSPLNYPASVEGDSAVVDTKTVDSPIRHTTNGKKVIHSLLLQQSRTKNFPYHCKCWELRADSTRYYWCIISCSSSLDRGYHRKGIASSSPFILL